MAAGAVATMALRAPRHQRANHSKNRRANRRVNRSGLAARPRRDRPTWTNCGATSTKSWANCSAGEGAQAMAAHPDRAAAVAFSPA